MLRVSNSRPTPCKGAALPTELSTPGIRERGLLSRSAKNALLHHVLEALAGLELRLLAGGDFHRFAGAGVTAHAAAAFRHGEGAEAEDGDVFALGEGFADGLDEGVDGFAGLVLGDVGLLGNQFNDFGLVHSSLSTPPFAETFRTACAAPYGVLKRGRSPSRAPPTRRSPPEAPRS